MKVKVFRNIIKENIKHILRESKSQDLKVGNVIKYGGENHEVIRIEGDRIYIRPYEDSKILGKRNIFWIKKEDLKEIDVDTGKDAYNTFKKGWEDEKKKDPLKLFK
jgi:hypothetical protein